MVRKAETKDIPKIHELLRQVCSVHHNGRPDLFKEGARKYSDEQLIQMIADENKPIFVAVDNNDTVLEYLFCIYEQHLNDSILTDIKTLYIDDLCVDENRMGQHIWKQLYDYAVNFAKEKGCYNLTLNVWSLNIQPRNFMNPVV